MTMQIVDSYTAALATHGEIDALVGDYASSVLLGADERVLELEKKIRNAVPTGIYRHFKSTDQEPKEYAVIGVEKGVEPGSAFKVVYAALYVPHLGKLATRRLVGTTDAFLMPIKLGANKERPEYEGARFTLVRRTHPSQLFNLIDDAYSRAYPPDTLKQAV